MPGMSGLALFEQLLVKGMAQAWPVIFLTGHADVPTAVDSVKRGAFDFCEKPFSDNALVDRVEQALALSQERLAARQTQQRLQSRLLELTERERDVMRLVVEGGGGMLEVAKLPELLRELGLGAEHGQR
jgi:two-component system response regulator DctR